MDKRTTAALSLIVSTFGAKCFHWTPMAKGAMLSGSPVFGNTAARTRITARNWHHLVAAGAVVPAVVVQVTARGPRKIEGYRVA